MNRPPISPYDRNRLLEDEVEPDRLKSLRDVTWEHQQAAMVAGYNSVLEMAVDGLIEELLELKERVKVLEER